MTRLATGNLEKVSYLQTQCLSGKSIWRKSIEIIYLGIRIRIDLHSDIIDDKKK